MMLLWVKPYHLVIVTLLLLICYMIPIQHERSITSIIDDYIEMDKSLQGANWDALFSDNNVSEICDDFNQVLNNAVSKFVPCRKMRTRQRQLSWTSGIVQSRKLKQKDGISIWIQRTVVLITAIRWL